MRMIWFLTACNGYQQTILADKEFKQRTCVYAISRKLEFEPVHEISNNVACATSKASDQPAHTRSLIRAFACRLSFL